MCVFWLLWRDACVPSPVSSDYLWSQLHSSATIAKVPAVGAAPRDKTGKTEVSEAPLNIIRLWWMGSGVGSQTISLPIKHAWGESFIAGRNKAALPSRRVLTSRGKKKNPVSLATKLALCHRNGKEVQTEGGVMWGGGCLEAWGSVLTSSWPQGNAALRFFWNSEWFCVSVRNGTQRGHQIQAELFPQAASSGKKKGGGKTSSDCKRNDSGQGSGGCGAEKNTMAC